MESLRCRAEAAAGKVRNTGSEGLACWGEPAGPCRYGRVDIPGQQAGVDSPGQVYGLSHGHAVLRALQGTDDYLRWRRR